MGLPVVTTNWSAPTAFLSDRNAYLIPVADLEPAYAREPQLLRGANPAEHKWAAVDRAALRRLMRHVFTHQKLARETGAHARRTVRSCRFPSIMSENANFWSIRC